MNDPSPIQEHLVSMSEAARELCLSTNMVRKLIQQGKLDAEVTVYGRAVTRESLEQERQRRVDEGKL